MMATTMQMKCLKSTKMSIFEDISSFFGIEKSDHMMANFRFANFFLHLVGRSYGDAK